MTIERELRALQSKVQRLESELHRQPVVDWFGGKSAPSYLWICQGGNTIPTLGRTGISRRSPDSVISPSELPDGAPGTGLIIVPASPIPAGLPNGIGVIQNIAGESAFCRIDQGFAGAFGAQDIASGEGVFVGGISNIDKVGSGVTWRYVCYSPIFGYF